MSVEQKIPTWGVKNFKYEVGSSSVVKAILLEINCFIKEIFFCADHLNKSYSPSSKPWLFNLTLEMIYCLKRLYLEVFVVIRDNKL